MILIDKMKNFKIYKTKTYLPTKKDNKKKHSAVLLLTPNYESSKKLMNFPLFVNKKRYESYFLDRDVSFYIGKDKLEEIDESKDESKLDDNFEKKSGLSFKYIDIQPDEGLNDTTKKYISEEWLNGKYIELAICEEDDKLAGFIYVNKSGKIGQLRIYDKYRGYGLSEVLLKNAIEKFGGNELGVYSDNEVAIKLYKKFGFTEVDRKVYKDGDEVIIMSLKKSTNESYIEERSLPKGPITLYHGSWNGTYDKILANSPNNGKKWEKISQSSFWFKEKKYAIMFATAELLREKSKKKIYILIDDDMKTLVPEEYRDEAEEIIKKNKSYVYIKTVDGKDVSGGQGRNFPEYTLEFSVKPDEVYENTYSDMKSSIKFVSQDYMEKVIEKYKKNKMTYGNSLLGQFIDSIIYDGQHDIIQTKRDIKKYNEAFGYNPETILETKRSNLKDSDFGIPEDRKFPLDTEQHVRSAIKLFGHAEESKKKSLAKKIYKRAKDYGIEVPNTTQVYKYIHEEVAEDEFKDQEKDDNLYFKYRIPETDVEDIDFEMDDKENRWNSVVTIKNVYPKVLRGRSECIVIKDDEIFLDSTASGICSKNCAKQYDVPGGGWDPGEPHDICAIRETNEEAKLEVTDVQYIGNYLNIDKERLEGYYCDGLFSKVYVGKYAGKYTGPIADVDRADIVISGRFYSINDVFWFLNPLHQEAILTYFGDKAEEILNLADFEHPVEESYNIILDEDKVDTEPMLTAPAITKEYYKKSKAVGPRAQEGDYLINSYVEVEGFDKPLRSRSEVLIIKDGNKVFCDKIQAAASRIKPDSFPYPGGSWEQGEDHGKTAQREAQEEARINTTNLRYAGNYVIKMKHPEPWCALHLPKSEWWYGYYTEVYVADYSGEFKGNVPLVDQDDLGDKGKFVPIKDIYHKLRPVQKHGIDAFVYKKSVKEDVEFTIET